MLSLKYQIIKNITYENKTIEHFLNSDEKLKNIKIKSILYITARDK